MAANKFPYFSSTTLVLLCPAWKNWGAAKTVRPDTVILHSRADDVIPFADSEELSRISGAALIEVGSDHRLADPEPLAAMLAASERHNTHRYWRDPEAPMPYLTRTFDKWHLHWSNASGWAPDRSSELLSGARLDWLGSLARTLSIFEKAPLCDKSQSGHLILGWAALGAIVEGSMKFFLSIYALDYERSVKDGQGVPLFTNYWNSKTSSVTAPDGLMLEKLRQFFQSVIWMATDGRNWTAWVAHIRDRRNAIHAYKDRDIGTFDEFWIDVGILADFIYDLDSRLPQLPERYDY